MPYPQREWQNRPYGDPAAPAGAARLNAAFFEELESWGISVDNAIEDGSGGSPEQPSSTSRREIAVIASNFEPDTPDGVNGSSGLIISPLHNDVAVSGVVFDGTNDPGRYRFAVKHYPGYGLSESWLDEGHLVADKIQTFATNNRPNVQRRLFFDAPLKLVQDSVYGLFVINLENNIVVSTYSQNFPASHDFLRFGFSINGERDNGAVSTVYRSNYYPAAGIYVERTGVPNTVEPPEKEDIIYPKHTDVSGKISFCVPYNYDSFHDSPTTPTMTSAYKTKTEFFYDTLADSARSLITGIEILDHVPGSSINVEIINKYFNTEGEVFVEVASKDSVAPTDVSSDVEVIFDTPIDLPTLATNSDSSFLGFYVNLSFVVETSGVYIPTTYPAINNRRSGCLEVRDSYYADEMGQGALTEESLYQPFPNVAPSLRLIHADT